MTEDSKQNDTTSESKEEPLTDAGGPAIAILTGIALIIIVVVWVMNQDRNPSQANEEPGNTPQQMEEDTPTSEETIQNIPNETPDASKELAALPVELPNANFEGTPKDIPPGARMLPQTGKDRGPYFLPKDLVAQLENVALDKPVTSSDPEPFIGGLELVTDGDKDPLDGRWVELAPGPQWVQIDLGKSYEAFAILIWHTHTEARIYRDVVVQVSDDPEFKAPITLFNNDFDNSLDLGKGEDYEYFENYEGMLIPLYDEATGGGTTLRYLRAYSNGSTNTDANHYTEIEVWARP